MKDSIIKEHLIFFNNCSMLSDEQLKKYYISKGNLQLDKQDDFRLASQVCSFLLSSLDVSHINKFNREIVNKFKTNERGNKK